MQLMVQFKVQLTVQFALKLMAQLVRLPLWPRLSSSLWRKRLLLVVLRCESVIRFGLALTVAGVNGQSLAAVQPTPMTPNTLAANNSGSPRR